MEVRAVFLVGFMGSGKSSVGRELARQLDWDFVDLDTRIESRERQTVPEIFRERGETGFRLAETDALRDLLAESGQPNRVVALGGGAFVQERNREFGLGFRFFWKRRHPNSGNGARAMASNGRCAEIRRSSNGCTRKGFPSTARRAW